MVIYREDKVVFKSNNVTFIKMTDELSKSMSDYRPLDNLWYKLYYKLVPKESGNPFRRILRQAGRS